METSITNRQLSSSLILSFLLLTATAKKTEAQTEIMALKFKSAKEFQLFFKHTGENIPVISGHRGGTTTGYPENCIATFENTLKYTPAFFEIDPRLTKDSIAVLMHDETLDRTTTGKGKVSDYTLAELQKFSLKDPQGNVTAYKIPTLDQVIRWSKGKTILNLDHKDVPPEMIVKIIKECNNNFIMLTVHNPTEASFYYHNNPRHMLSAFVLSKDAFYSYEKAGVPWQNLIAYIGATNKPGNKELMDLLHQKKVMCMISAAPSYDKLNNPAERALHYRETFAMGADILESDLPIEVAAALKPILPKSGIQRKFLRKVKLE
ncbi:Glycerophosphoryl diester phosphodiesterase [Arcticibacter svalbardensis MN12-7]|uniref:Glycerophosphoryl diester phosphodiesterase n=1 Tax=Arcticibacter svalbardensis MN12-7 TaxID=1150600 RepID=R9GY95_9SPHI|nr:glycerophosphodiester phosphodiesterase family protein [Arcticibacter svalbardensis]EOR96782.1 Glycerophosphoryl diester phosphodiesterase [Arcticibacter svalbardensis MN12-7]